MSLLVGAAPALGEGQPSSLVAPVEGSGASTSLSAPLVTPGSPTAGEELQAAHEAELANPETVAAREASTTRYENENQAQAIQTLGEAFASVVDEPDGGPPKLAAGESITGYAGGGHIAQVALSGGGHGVVEATAPVALETSSGGWTPVDLGLSDVGGAFEPRVTAVGVRIPKRLDEGVSLSNSGVSLTPVDAQGAVLGGSEGVVDGASVFFANTQTDADTIAKPTSTGFVEDTLLRSVESPERLSYRVGLPKGASLVQATGGAGPVQVVDEGAVIALVLPPSAVDAAGVAVPVSWSVSAGDVLTLTVNHRAGQYTYPIDIDPTVVDKYAWEYQNGTKNWTFTTSTEAFSEAGICTPTCGPRPAIEHSGGPSYQRGQFAYLEYKTQGESKIYSFRLDTHRESEDTLTAPYISLAGSGYEAGPKEIPLGTLCCETWFEVSATGSYGNSALFETVATGEGSRDFVHEIYKSEVGISQEKGPSVSLSPPTGWVNREFASVGVEARDPGLGVESITATMPGFPEWHPSKLPPCLGAQCASFETASFMLNGLPEGEDTIEAVAKDPVGLTATASGKVKIDDAAPRIMFSGLGSGNVIGERGYALKVEAMDGSGSTPSSGVKSIAAFMDGQELGKRSGSCSPGPCSSVDEWQINGNEFGAGEHKLRIVATDNAGNTASEEIVVKVHHATPVAVGPGVVNPASGQFSLNATDVSIGSPGATLTVGRGAYSRNPSVGSAGPLGSQWSLNVGSQEDVVRMGESARLDSANGGKAMFTSNGKGGYVAPKGDANLSLSGVKNENGQLVEYVLADPADAGRTHFTPVSGESGVFKPTRQEGPLASQSVRSSYQVVEGVTEPVEELAPEAAGVLCGTKVEELKDGCRALTFKYATETTAKGENKSKWGEYKGRLVQVVFHAYNPSSKAMEEKAVAQYAYDAQGRLRAEWDPRVSPELETDYGYDGEGHVTAVTPPGQESWALTYGTISGDPNGGRLLKVMRPSVSTSLWAGEPPSSTEAPKLSGTPAAGVRMAVSNGVWAHSPVTYGYQWERCNKEGKECAPILGATNANYQPGESDLGHTLLALVTATNGGGSVVASTAVSARVSAAEEYSVGSDPYGIVAGPDGNLWFTKFWSKIGKITTSGTVTEYSGASAPTEIASGPDKNLWYTDELTSKIGKITTSGTVTEYALPKESAPLGIAAGPDGNLWFVDHATSKIGKITTSGTITEYSLAAGIEPIGVTTGPDNNLWFTANLTKVGKVTTAGVVTEYALGYAASGIASGPDGNLWVTEPSAGKIAKVTTSGSITQYTLPSGSEPEGISVGSDKNLWFTEHGKNKIGKITTSGTITEYALPPGTGPEGIAAGPDEKLWFAGESSGVIGKIATGPVTEGEQRPPSAGSTIEYRLSASGTGLPNLTKEETEKWGQKDSPVEGMAVFPPNEPQGWPATDYKRASIEYLDEEDHVVNTSSPTGAITTTEYNEQNDVVRTLSPDNRFAALKETCESKEKCKSAEVAKLLDFESVYNTTGGEPGTQLLETLGPQRTVKLAQGKEKPDEEALARDHTRYFYDEEAPAEGGPYDLVTKTIDGAQTASKEEFDKRETVTSYAGQEGLGWELRKPTSVTTDPNGLKLTHSTFYDPNTGNVIETRMPGGGGGSQANGYAYSAQYSKETEGETCTPISMKSPDGVAFDSSGDAWVVDTGSDRVDELSPTGRTVLRFGGEGTGSGQFKEPRGIAIDKENHVWVSDTGNNRVQEFSSKGEFIKTFGVEGKENGQFKKPVGIAINSEGYIWVADSENYRVEEFSPTGTYTTKASLLLGKPEGVAVDSKRDVWVTGSDYVWEFSPTGTMLGKFGGEGSENGKFKGAVGLAVSGEDVYVADSGNSRVQEFKFTEKEGKTTGEYIAQFGTNGTGTGQFKEPQGLIFDKEGHIWLADTGNNRVQELGVKGEYIAQLSNVSETCMKNPGSVALDSTGNVWVADTSNDRVVELSSTGKDVTRFGNEGTGNGQFKEPHALAIDSSGNVWVADTGNNRVQELSAKGEFIKAFGTEGKENGQLKRPSGIAINAEGDVWVADSGNQRIQEFSPAGVYMAQATFFSRKPESITVDAKGNVWTVATNYVWDYSPTTGKTVGYFGGNGTFNEAAGIAISGEDVFVTERGNDRIEEFEVAEKEGALSYEYLTQFGVGGGGNGQFKEPLGVGLDKEGHVWVADTGNNRVQEFVKIPSGPHSMQTIYYSTAPNLRYPGCGGHPEWANLPCQTQPTEQPGTSGLPNLPVTTYSAYSMFDELETKTETVGSTTRTATTAYDAAGRVKTSSVSSSVGTGLPTITSEYSTETGTLIKECANEGKPCTEGKPKTITSTFNALGQLTSYTDAGEATTTYEYEGEGAYKNEKEQDGRLRHVNDGKGAETYTYNETTGLLSELLNEYGTTKLTFTATYDTEGNMLTEGYPNGMNASYTYNALDAPTSLEYKKTTHCTEKCTWFSDTVVPSIHGQWLEQSSTLSHQAYTYDNAGRLTHVQNIPTGKGCTTRIYAYDEDTNRTSLTTREPNAKGECATEGGAIEKHTYDTADRLTDTGTAYNTFGDITALPATDAGGKETSEELTSTYYTDNQLASQTQNGQTIGYNLDPVGRTMETVATGKKVANTTLHYAGSANAPAWTSNNTGETTRNIPGISGQLAAIQNNSEAPELQLANLHGDIIAKAYLSETATGLASTADTSEFGVPTISLPSKYSWLGGLELPTELPSGAIDMGARSYIPQIGRFLQPDPISGGSANAYAYTFGDPVNSSDPSGQSTIQELVAGHASEVAHEYQVKEEAEIAARAALRAAEEAAAREAAEAAAQEASWARWWENYDGRLSEGASYGGEEEWYEEEGEEEGEEAAFHSNRRGQGAPFLDEGLFSQPEGEEAPLAATHLQEGTKSEVISKAMRLCRSVGANTRSACAQFINYVLKMSRRKMKKLGGILLAGGEIAGQLPIPNAVVNLLAKAGGAYLRALGQAMLNATQMSGRGGCFLSFHTFKLPIVGDTGVPDGAYAAGCH